MERLLPFFLFYLLHRCSLGIVNVLQKVFKNDWTGTANCKKPGISIACVSPGRNYETKTKMHYKPKHEYLYPLQNETWAAS